jgi:hypothetical protein
MIRIEQKYKAINASQHETKKGKKFTVLSVFIGKYDKETKKSDGVFYKLLDWTGTNVESGDSIEILKIENVKKNIWIDRNGKSHEDIELSCKLKNHGEYIYEDKNSNDKKSESTEVFDIDNDDSPF